MEPADFDSIIFDCDGVLVDITDSYDRTIDKTCTHILKKLASISAISIDDEIIDGFKKTGGFNDEVILAFACILSLYAAQKLGRAPKEFIFDVIKNADRQGLASVRQYLGQLLDMSEFESKLGDPKDRHNNMVYSVFDQIFFGPTLYEKMFARRSEFAQPPMIDADRVIVSGTLMDTLRKRFGRKIAIVSGRGIESIRYSLKETLDYFDQDSSAFLEDEPSELAKPNPATLVRAVKSMGAKNCLYVGDSMEDYIMAAESDTAENHVTFCAIIGASKNPARKRGLFEELGVKIILDSIDQIPKILNLAR